MLITSQMIDRFIEQKQISDYANATINRWLEASTMRPAEQSWWKRPTASTETSRTTRP